MARIRSIKPSFFTSEDVAALPFRARLTWIGLWTHCDDAGRTKDNVRLIKAAIWPLDDVSLAQVEEDLITLASHGRIVRYEVDGQRYLAVANWWHQKINRPTPTVLPEPSLNGHGPIPNGSPREGKGLEGKGGDARAREEPPTRCPKHLEVLKPPPCGPCADARKAHEAWEAERRERLNQAKKCPLHRGQLAHNCSICRSEELAPA